MPVVRALAFARLAAWPGFVRALGWTARLVVAGIGIFALALLLLRMVVFPHIDVYRDTIAAAMSRQLGQPVSIDALHGAWDGWNPKLVIEGFRMLDANAQDGPPLLELPAIDCTVAWTSLPFLDLRFRQLTIERPRLALRRDANGLVHVAGLELDPTRAKDGSPFTAWLLRQPEIVVRGALITWTDERRQAPQLVLDDVHFRLENAFGRHRFGLRGTPPPELAAPLDVRGDLVSASLTDWQRAEGRLYVRLDYADVAAWREWLPLPLAIESGKGALRTWFTLARGEAREVIADLELVDVRTTLAPELPPLALARVAGRLAWRIDRPTRELRAQQVDFVTADGAAFAPSNLTLVWREAEDVHERGGEFTFDRLDLGPLLAIAPELPLPQRVRDELARFRPNGRLTHGSVQWDGAPDAPGAFRVATEFTGLSVFAQAGFPGGTGLSGSVRADEGKGRVKLASQGAVLALPHVFVDTVPLDSVQAELEWLHEADRLTLRLLHAAFANADGVGQASGTWRALASGRGEIDVTAHVSRANVQAMPRYLPAILPETVRHWLVRAITSGRVEDARLRLKGNLDAFPFAQGKGGTFVVTARGKDLNLAFADGWPAFTGIDANLRFEGAGMRVEASDGRMLGARVTQAIATIEDLRASHPPLAIKGAAAGATREFLRFLAQSPVGGWAGHPEASFDATGEGKLTLDLVLPLGDLERHRVSGEYALLGNDVSVAGAPALSNVTGALAFTERELRARDLTAQILGGPAKIGVVTADRQVRVSASGTAGLASVRREFPLPLLDRASGAIDWTLALDARPEGTTWTVESSLRGTGIDLPAPLAKSAADTLPLRIERRVNPATPGEDTLLATYGRSGAVAVHRRTVDGALDVDRMHVAIGRAAERASALRAERPGVWVRAEVPALDLDAWLDVVRTARAPNTGGPAARDLELAGIDLDTASLDMFDRRWRDLKVSGRRAQGDWRFDLKGGDIAGQATWSTPKPDAPNGRVVARLARFAVPASDHAPERAPTAQLNARERAWPELDITADSFANNGREYGRLELRAQPRDAEWRIERVVIANDTARMSGEGAWRTRVRPQQTRLDLALDFKDAGALLARFGHPGAVQGAPGKITGQLAWAGAPTDFDYPTLSGAFRLDVGSGRFTKTEPGLGKLLGVLSLQALPRRITLDFRDVFSEGFTFDRVNGDVRIENGVMTTDNLRMAGPSAQVSIAGEADLASETQRLRVRVQPTLTAGVSAGAALFFLANPVIGAAVGAGSLLAQKVLRDPIEQIFSYEYMVSGSWSDPVVARAGTATAAGTPK